MGNFKKYLSLLDEVVIDKNSTLRQKFLKFVKAHFLTVNEAVESVDKSDLELFMRYCLLKKNGQPNIVSLTNKGIAVVVGMNVNSNDPVEKFTPENILEFVKCSKKEPETLRGWLKIFANNKIVKLALDGKTEVQ